MRKSLPVSGSLEKFVLNQSIKPLCALHRENRFVSHLGILFKEDQTSYVTSSCEIAALILQYSPLHSRVSRQGSHLPNQSDSDNRSLTCDVAQPHTLRDCLSLRCQYPCLIAPSNIYSTNGHWKYTDGLMGLIEQFLVKSAQWKTEKWVPILYFVFACECHSHFSVSFAYDISKSLSFLTYSPPTQQLPASVLLLSDICKPPAQCNMQMRIIIL